MASATLARSLLFAVVFYANTAVFLVGGSWLLLAPRRWAMAGLARVADADAKFAGFLRGLELPANLAVAEQTQLKAILGAQATAAEKRDSGTALVSSLSIASTSVLVPGLKSWTLA